MRNCTYSEKSKYDDIAPLVLAIYKDYTKREIAELLGISFHAVMHICYFNRKKLKQKTKDKRAKGPWTTRDYKVLFSGLGNKSLSDISKEIGRSARNDHSHVKEKLAALGISTHWFRGMRVRDFKLLYPKDMLMEFGVRKEYLCNNGYKKFQTSKRVPWKNCLEASRITYGEDSFVFKMCEIYCMFSKWTT